jgi:hypothetical protein
MSESKSAVLNGIEQLASVVAQDKLNFEEMSLLLTPLLALQSASQKLHLAFTQQFGKLIDVLTEDQLDATIDGLQSMYYELLMTTSVLLRLRTSDAMNHQRKLIELAAFIHEHLADPESAKRWKGAIHPGKLETSKRQKYKKRYQAHQLVDKHFKRSGSEQGHLIGLNYDASCFFVHPSVIYSRDRIVKNERKYSLLSHDQKTEETINTVVSLVIGVHGLFMALLDSLATVLDCFEEFDNEVWQTAIDEWTDVWEPLSEDNRLAFSSNSPPGFRA